MKKILLLVTSIVLFSCSKENEVDPNAGKLVVDYKVTSNYDIKDLAVTPTNEINILSVNTTNYDLELKKIDLNGNLSIISNNLSKCLGETGLIITQDSKQHFFTDFSSNKIFTYYNGQLSSHTLANNNGQLSETPIIGKSCKYSGNSAIFYDARIKSLKLFLFDTNSESNIAGSGNSAIVDGNGSNASFKDIQKMISKNNKIYIIDDYHNLRKIEYINNVYNVTTLISNFTENLDDVAIDANNDVYVLSSGKGIYKLNQINNTLALYKNGLTYIKPVDNNQADAIDWENLTSIYINENDLYAVNAGTLIKVSNFKSKI